MRKILYNIHLWLGIITGIILFIVCLSGTIMVYDTDIYDMAIGRSSVSYKKGEKVIPLKNLIYKVEKEKGKKALGYKISNDKSKPYIITISPKKGDRRSQSIAINQYTGELLSERSKGYKKFHMFFFKLHRWLLLDINIGRPIVGWSTIAFILICLTGLYLWIPKKIKNIKKGFKVNIKKGSYKLFYDLHSTLGFYSLVLILIMAVTGLFWSFGWYRDMMEVFTGKNFKSSRENIEIESKEIEHLELSTFYTILNNFDSEKQSINVYKRNSKEKLFPVTIRVQSKSSTFDTANDTYYLHPQTGEILKSKMYKDMIFGEKFIYNVKPLHLGNFWGGFSKFLYFISCLIATSLPITGVIIWIKKLLKKNIVKEKKKTL